MANELSEEAKIEVLGIACDCADAVNMQGLVFEDTGLYKLHAAWSEYNAVRSTTPDSLKEFQEGQWWVKELDALVQRPDITDDQKRAVAVIHNLLKQIHSN